MKRILIALVLLLALGDMAARLIAHGNTQDIRFNGTVRIAYVGQLGDGNRAAVEMAAGAADLVERVNADGGINGLKVELVSFDDDNDAEKAKSIARQIGDDPSILAVIGHSATTTSIAAGPIYAKAGIPAIAPRSTAPEITDGNSWYFRAIYSDDRAAEFLARYARDVLGTSGVAVIRTPTKYADRMSGVLRRELAEQSLPILAEWQGDPLAAGADKDLAVMTQKLSKLPPDSVVMLLAGIRQAPSLIQAIRESGVKLRILGPDLLGTTELTKAFAKLPREQVMPGFYTAGLFVSAPFLPDTANVEARQLIQRLSAQIGPIEGWQAPYAYDAAKLLVEAMRRAEFSQQLPDHPRQVIRDKLAEMRSPALATPGATGLNWFDSSGNAVKPVTIGQFSNQLMSSLMQLHQNPQKEDLVRVPVVYGGLSLRSVELVPDNHSQADVTFDLWFRYQGDVPAADVAFAGAVRPVVLGDPVRSSSVGGIEYRLYRANGRFQLATEGVQATQGRLGLGIAFHHRSLPQSQIIYVPDATATPALSGPRLVSLLTQTAILPSGVSIVDATLLADSLERSSLGDPNLSMGATSVINAPGLALTIDLARENSGLRRQWLDPKVEVAAAVLAVAFCLLLGLQDGSALSRHPRIALLLLIAVTGGLLLCAENTAMRLLTDLRLEHAAIGTVRLFDFLWWLASCSLVIAATNALIWVPLERATGRPVPRVVKTFTNIVVIILTMVGIVSNVFQRDVTGLVATSGLVAMIIGLAVQSNLANVFSGIALNIERQIRPGDWIKIGDGPVAQVMDISWRATKVRTFDNTIINIPNTVVTGVRLENFSFPDSHFLIERTRLLPIQHDPARVIRLITDALQTIHCADGRRFLEVAKVVFAGQEGMDAARYQITFDCIDRSKAAEQESVVMLTIEKTLRRAGIIAGIIAGTEAAPGSSPLPSDHILALLAEIAPFSSVSDETRQVLAGAAIRQALDTETVLYREGDPADAIYLVADGVLSARRITANGPSEADRYGPASAAGVEALLTDAQRPVTLSTIGPAVVYRLDRQMVADVLAQHATAIEHAEDMIARAQLTVQALDGGAAADRDTYQAMPKRILSHIGQLFSRSGRD